MSDIKREFVFKAVLMGEGSVGKTSIRSKFMGVGFKSEYIKTIGADFASKAIVIGENKVHFQIWDLAGQNMYKHVRSSFYSGCKCGFLVFDLTEPETLEKLDTWVEEAIQHSGGFLKIFIIIGNKNDLVDDIKVDDEEIEKLAQKLREMKDIEAAYIKTSALTGENIHEAFEMMGKMFLEKEGFPRKGAEGNEGQFFRTDAPIKKELQTEKSSNKAFSTISALNKRINHLTNAIASLEEKILFIESKKPSKKNVEEIKNLKQQIDTIQDEIEHLPEKDEEPVEQKNDDMLDDMDLLASIPTIDEISEKVDATSKEKKVKDEQVLEEAKVIKVDEEEETDDLDLLLPIINVHDKKEDEEIKKTRCPNCGSKLSFIKQYNRWYCYHCKLYV